MDRAKLLEYAHRLEGISWREWELLQMIINNSFQKQDSELKKPLQLASVNELEKIIHSRFG